MIKELNHKKLYDFLKSNNFILNEDQLIEIRDHKYTEDLTFWGRDRGYLSYSVVILKDNGNIYDEVDIYVKNN